MLQGGQKRGRLRTGSRSRPDYIFDSEPQVIALSAGERGNRCEFTLGLFSNLETVLRSGVYRVTHQVTRSRRHNVICTYGMTFPFCKECGPNCEFIFRVPAQEIADDKRFKPINCPTTGYPLAIVRAGKELSSPVIRMISRLLRTSTLLGIGRPAGRNRGRPPSPEPDSRPC